MFAPAAKRTVLAAASISSLVAVTILVGAAGASPEPRDREAPSAPENVRVVSATPTLVHMAWDDSVDDVGVVGYYVTGDKGRPGGGEKDSGRVTVDKPEYTVRGLECGQSAVITVVAFDDSQNRSSKVDATVSTAACADTQPPSTPSGFTQVATSETAVVLAWTPSADNVGVVEYGVYRDLQRMTTLPEPNVTISGLSCGSTYTRAVDAADAAGNRSPLATAYVRTAACAAPSAPAPAPSPSPPSDTTPPSAPTGLTASSVTQTGLTLGWNASSDNVGVAGYDVYRNGAKVASASTTTSSQTGLACGTSYALAVVARDAAGNSSSQAQLTTSTTACSTAPAPSPSPPSDTTPPSAPSGLTASSVTQTGLTLGWNASSDNVGVAGYDVYRNGTKVASVGTTTSSQTGLACGTSYALAVVARDAAGNSSSQAQLTAATTACPAPAPPTDTTPPSMPTGLAIASAARTTVSLTWSASTDNVAVQGYQTWVNGAHGSTTLQPGSTVLGLTCGTAYTFEVGAFDAEGNRSSRASVIGSTAACADTQAPTAPANLVATSRTTTSIALSWSASSDNLGVTGYGLYRGGTLTGTSAATTGIFSGLACNTNYTLAVDAFDAAGNRSAKTTVLVSTTACPDTTPPSAPTGLAASNVTQTGLTLSWNPSTDNFGVTAYDVYRNGTKMSTVTATSAAQTGLICGTSYSFGVVARDVAGNSSAQTTLSASTSACTPAATSWTGPITITQGGTYSGSWESTTSAPAIRIATTQPVVIQNSRVRNLTGARLIVSDWPLAVQLTLRNVQGFGGAGRFVELEGYKSFRMENCTLDMTSGVRLNLDAPGSTTVITGNKHRNIQHDAGSAFGNFVQFNWIRNGTIDVSWNEILNNYNQSHPEDIVSLINTANARVHDNYFQHSSTPGNAYNTSSQGTVTLEQGSRGNEIYNNQFVDTVNGVYFGPDEADNTAHHNRLIQDGKLPNGTQMGNGYSGMSIHAGGTNNRMYDNVVGYVNRDGVRMDWWPMDGAPDGAAAEIARNTTLPGPITLSTEQNEWTLWLQKLASSSVTLGA